MDFFDDDTENINSIKNVFTKYISDNHVYGYIDDYIVIFEKPTFEHNIIMPKNIIDEEYAEYKTENLKILNIFNKYYINDTPLSYISIHDVYSTIIYSVGDYFQQEHIFYNSILVPYFHNLSNKKLYLSWYPNGFLSEKGYYENNEKTGIWKYGSSIKKTPETEPTDFTYIEYKNGNIVYKNQIINYVNSYSNLFESLFNYANIIWINVSNLFIRQNII
jgi:hypothetical protein